MEPPALTPVTPQSTPQPILDAEHLRLLSLFHYILGGLAVLGGLFPLLHVGVGIMMVAAEPAVTASSGESLPFNPGWFFILIGGTIIAVFQTLGILMLMTGSRLAKRRKRTFCMIVAGITCVQIPLGTILGIFTILVLQRPSVIPLFDREE